jgi:hypothetical protein
MASSPLLDPRADIIGVAHGRHDAEQRTGKRSAEFGDQLLEGIFLGAVRSAEIAIEARLMTTGMGQFMERRAVPIDRLEIGRRRRHLHVILRRRIEGAIAADAEVDAGRLDQGLDCWLDHAGKRWRYGGRDIGRQAVALIAVKDGKPLEEWNGLRFLAGLVRSPLFFGRHETISVDHRSSAFALADMAAESESLA